MRAGKRRPKLTVPQPPSAAAVDVLRRRLTNPDPRTHAEFLAHMKDKQAAGLLANPATAALLDRLERVTR